MCVVCLTRAVSMGCLARVLVTRVECRQHALDVSSSSNLLPSDLRSRRACICSSTPAPWPFLLSFTLQVTNMTDRQNVLPLPAELLLLETLPSLQSTLFDLRALLRSPYPPRSLYIHAPSNLSLVRNVIRVSLPCPSSSCSDIDDVKADRTRRPHIQDLLPRACFVDCAELASQKALFARILNTLSGWGTGEWNEAIGGVLNWDGRQEDWSVRRSRRGSRKGRDASDEVLYEIVWDYTAAAARAATSSRGLLEERKDESSSGFLDGLRALYALGAGNPPATRMPTTTTKKPSNGKDSEREDVPRFIVIENADRLSSLESLPVGQSEGTLLAVVMRLGELVSGPEAHTEPVPLSYGS